MPDCRQFSAIMAKPLLLAQNCKTIGGDPIENSKLKSPPLHGREKQAEQQAGWRGTQTAHLSPSQNKPNSLRFLPAPLEALPMVPLEASHTAFHMAPLEVLPEPEVFLHRP